MVSLATVEEQLKKIGCSFKFWNRAEVKELSLILLPDETIAQCIGGYYEGGYAMLCATNCRILLVDKKPRYLTLKDVRYDMITELDFSHRMMNGTVNIYTPNKTLKFTAYNQIRLRQLFHHAQEKVMEGRYHFNRQAQAPEIAPPQPVALLPAEASDNEAPVFKPNLSQGQNHIVQDYMQHIPLEPAEPEPLAKTSAQHDTKPTAYANMPLIMSGWRRRVYGHHLHPIPQRRGFRASEAQAS